MQVSRKIQAAVRHSAYNTIHMNGKDKVTPEELDQILLKIKNDEQEDFRVKALALFNIQIPQGNTAKQLLQKAYVKFSTVSSIVENSKTDKKFYRSHFQVLVSQEQKTHGEILEKLLRGERVPGIEKDPLLSAEADIVMEYNMIPGYVRKETSTVGDDKLRMAPHKGTTDQVKSAMDKFKQKKKELDERKKKREEASSEKVHEEPAAEEEDQKESSPAQVEEVKQEQEEEKKADQVDSIATSVADEEVLPEGQQEEKEEEKEEEKAGEEVPEEPTKEVVGEEEAV